MKEKHVDARGLNCPQPVILTRKAIREAGAETIRVTVDNEVASENVQRMAKRHGWNASIAREGKDIPIVLTKAGGAADAAPEEATTSNEYTSGSPSVVVFVPSNLFGVGDEELGRILMRSFIKTLKDVEPRPSKVIFINSGVRLSTEGSDLIDDLGALERAGVEILSCGTCLDYYRLKDSLRVGTSSNMYEIVMSLITADRVLRP